MTKPHSIALALALLPDAYAAAPVCSPTRAAVLTGLAPARLHITTGANMPKALELR